MKRNYRVFPKEDFVDLLEKYEADSYVYRNIYEDLRQIRLSKIDAQRKALLDTEKKLLLSLKREEDLKNQRNLRETLCSIRARYEILGMERKRFEEDGYGGGNDK